MIGVAQPQRQAYGFVLGTGRCGSTLVQEVLARHEDVGFLSNLDDRFALPPGAGRWNGPTYRRLPPAWQAKGRLRFAPSEGYRVLERKVSPILCKPVRDLTADDATPWLRSRTAAFFDARAKAQQRPMFLHKLTGWPRSGFLAAVFPGSRFVHVVRDGRSVASSWLQMPWWKGYAGPSHWQFGPLSPADEETWERSGRSFVVLAGLAWRTLVGSLERARAAADPGAWLDVRYEDVISDPGGTHRLMAEHLGLPWTPTFEAQLARYRFSAGRTQAYRADLDRRSAEMLDHCLQEHLVRWGYAG